MSDPRRAIPSVEAVLAAPEMGPLLAREHRTRVVAALRAVQDEVRSGDAAPRRDAAWYAEQTAARLDALAAGSLRRVINATGVILHTNLGRAPLSDAALLAIAETARTYTNLEYDLAAGARGSRYDHCAQLLRELTGAEDALVVNNNAAALVLALNTLAQGQGAIVSRGELVEIGGSFRVPDILQRSGAHLHEVGTTNRTHLRDYAEAIAADRQVLLKVHRSNFEMTGFVSEVDIRELGELAGDRGCSLIHDLGSGLLADLSDVGLTGEPDVPSAVRAAPGAITALSGDKLLGGPQAGILLGPARLIAALRANPLCRALRVDKLTLAALEATLRAYAAGRAREEIPVLRMLCAPAADIRARAEALRAELDAAGVSVQLVPGDATVGGGAFPGARIPSWTLAIDADVPAADLDRRLRAQSTPIVARIQADRLVVDLRTVQDWEDHVLRQALVHATRP